jgi:hypothetical protein
MNEGGRHFRYTDSQRERAHSKDYSFCIKHGDHGATANIFVFHGIFAESSKSLQQEETVWYGGIKRT